MAKNTVKLDICSQHMSIVADEEPSYIYELASEVNDRVDDIMQANKYRPVLSAIILSSLQFCDERNHALRENAGLLETLSALHDQNHALECEIADLKDKLAKQNSEIAFLNKKNENLSRQESFFEGNNNAQDKSNTPYHDSPRRQARNSERRNNHKKY